MGFFGNLLGAMMATRGPFEPGPDTTGGGRLGGGSGDLARSGGVGPSPIGGGTFAKTSPLGPKAPRIVDQLPAPPPVASKGLGAAPDVDRSAGSGSGDTSPQTPRSFLSDRNVAMEERASGFRGQRGSVRGMAKRLTRRVGRTMSR